MPYSVWLTTHARYEDVRANKPDTLTLDDLRSCLALLAGARPTREVRRPDGATWVFRKGESSDMAPLLWAGIRPNNGPEAGTLQLSVSTTHPRFLANFFELLTFAALVNEMKGLHAFEEIHGHELTVESVQQLTDPGSAYSKQQGQSWMQRRENLYNTTQMPLEFPAGQQDEGTDLLVLALEHPRLPSLTKLLARPPPGQGVEVRGNQGLWFEEDSQQPLTWFTLNTKAKNQLFISPHWGPASFVSTARTTFDVAFRLQTSLAGGRVLWNRTAVGPDGPPWLSRHPEILGVELLQLLTLGWEPASVPV